jgi:LmbE family N-acetylglucosaminyl deacetylase
MASWARRGARVDLLTVLACDPDSDAPAGGWDARAGFATEGESARARREEDRRACAILGIRPAWLPFGSFDYERHGDEQDVRAAVEEALGGADDVLIPGSPLTHPDHAWLARILAHLAAGSYAEQPYTRREGGDSHAFERARAGPRDRLAKWRAIREYRSQLPLLGMSRSIRHGPLSLALARESVTWSESRSGRQH